MRGMPPLYYTFAIRIGFEAGTHLTLRASVLSQRADVRGGFISEKFFRWFATQCDIPSLIELLFLILEKTIPMS